VSYRLSRQGEHERYEAAAELDLRRTWPLEHPFPILPLALGKAVRFGSEIGQVASNALIVRLCSSRPARTLSSGLFDW